MVIDIHTHTFPDKLAATTIPKLEGMSHTRAYVDGTVSGLRTSMARAGVDASLVLPVATNPRQVVHVNDSSAQINDLGPETGVYSFGCMHPDFSDYRAELSRVKELGMKGIKLHPVYQGVDFDDIRTLRILDRAAELGLIVLTHSGLDIGFPGEVRVTPKMVLHAIQEVGPLTLILAHMGGWRNWEEVEELLPYAPVYLDTSYSLGSIRPLDDGYYKPEDLPMMGEEQFLRIIRTFGYERFLFGTDSPWSGQQESLERFRALPLTDEEKDSAFRSYVSGLEEQGKAETYLATQSLPTQEQLDAAVAQASAGQTREAMEETMVQAIVQQTGMSQEEITEYTAAMSDEELAEFISRIEIGDFGPQVYGKTFCDMCKGQYECDDCRLWWLQQPAEEDT